MTCTTSLRPYQSDALSACLSHWAGGLCVLPTGAGKSHIIAALANELSDRDVLIVTPRIELTNQNKGKLYSNARCVTVNTAYRRNMTADVLIVDEAHLVRLADGMYQTLIKSAKVTYGFTATPFRLNTGYIVPKIFDTIIYDIGREVLVTSGYLAPRQYHYIPPELIINVRNQSFNSVKRLSNDACPQTGRCIEHYLRKCDGQALVFVCDTAHGKETMKLLPEARMIYHGLMPTTRHSILDQFKTGKLKYLVNCEILTTGFDFPALENIIILRPTDSYTLYEQICGRGDRICEDKKANNIWDYTVNSFNYEGTQANDKTDHNNFCLFCLELTDYRLRNCQHCDKRLIRGEAPKKECPFCKKQNHTVAVYCKFCGCFIRYNVNMIRFNRIGYLRFGGVKGVRAYFGDSGVSFDTKESKIKEIISDLSNADETKEVPQISKWTKEFINLKPAIIYWKKDRRHRAKFIKLMLDRPVV